MFLGFLIAISPLGIFFFLLLFIYTQEDMNKICFLFRFSGEYRWGFLGV